MVERIEGFVVCLFEGGYGFLNEDDEVVLVVVDFFNVGVL